MLVSGKFSDEQVRDYLSLAFAFGQPFCPAWQGWRLVDADANPLDAFIEHIQKNDGDVLVPYDVLARIVESMKVPDDGSRHADYLRGMWSAIMWLAFYRRDGVTLEAFSEREGVVERTIQLRIRSAIRYIRRELTAPARPEVVLPANFEPWHRNGSHGSHRAAV